MLEYFDFLLPSSHICESLKSQFPPTQLSQALKDYHDKTHYAVMADFVTDIILFDGILAGAKYRTPFGTFQQHY